MFANIMFKKAIFCNHELVPLNELELQGKVNLNPLLLYRNMIHKDIIFFHIYY